MVYADHAATSPLRPEAASAMEEFVATPHGNASGMHAWSRRAKNALEEARETVAGLLGTHPSEIVFTSGGTEADNLAVKGVALAGGGRRRLVISAIEHDAVLASAGFAADIGCEVVLVAPDDSGVVQADAVAASMTDETALVSVMAINNETGARQPVNDIAAVARRAASGVVVHTDAVQAAMCDDLGALDADVLSLSAHKFGGPTGVGVLMVRGDVRLEPTNHGGGQELGRRSGTHHVAGAIGLAAALERTLAEQAEFVALAEAERDALEQELSAQLDDVRFSAVGSRSPQHSHFRIPGVRAETLLVRLDQAGVAAAAGSACHSGAVEPSHVLSAMGVDEVAAGEYVRVSFGWSTRPGDGLAVAAAIVAAVRAISTVPA